MVESKFISPTPISATERRRIRQLFRDAVRGLLYVRVPTEIDLHRSRPPQALTGAGRFRCNAKPQRKPEETH